MREKLEATAHAIASLVQGHKNLEGYAKLVHNTLARGGKIITFGNGGSAAQAMHLAEELVGRYVANRRPYPAICLNADPTVLTCIANDFGFDTVFARQVEALASPNDLIVAFSTSGRSPNVVEAIKRAPCAVLLLTGEKHHCGDEIASIGIESDRTDVIQEAHLVIVHAILEYLEARPL